MRTEPQYYTVITDAGLALEAQSKANNTPVTIAQLAVGDSNGAEYDPQSSQTALYNEQWRGDLNALHQDSANPNWWVAEAILPDQIGGFTVREVGLYTDTGVLYSIGKYPPAYKPVLAQGSNRQIYVRAIFQTGNAANVTLLTNPAIVVATKEDLIDYAAPKVHQHDAADIATGTLAVARLPALPIKKITDLQTALDSKTTPAAAQKYVEAYAAKKAHRHAVSEMLPGGLVQQVLRKKSNASGDVEWVDLTKGVAINLNTREESQLLDTNQKTLDLRDITTNGIVVHIGGARLDRDGDFDIDTLTRLTLARPYPKGTKVTVSQNETAGTVINPLNASRNLSDVEDVVQARKNLGVLTQASPSGAVVYFAQRSAPEGWIKANGTRVSRTAYRALFAAIGTTFGAGDGKTTFTLPDLRGEFPRGWDDGRGVDVGRSFGSMQKDALNPSTLQVRSGWSSQNWEVNPGACNIAPNAQFGATASHNNVCGIKTGVIFGGGSETRPRNVALLACIKI